MERYNSLFSEAMRSDLSDSVRTHKLEQMKGVGYAIGLRESLIKELEEELNEKK